MIDLQVPLHTYIVPGFCLLSFSSDFVTTSAITYSPNWFSLVISLLSLDLFVCSSFPTPNYRTFQRLWRRPTTCSFANKPASHLFPSLVCQPMLCLSSSLMSLLRTFLQRRYSVWRCITVCSRALHHQHLDVSMAQTLARKAPIAPCPVFSW